VAGGGGAGCVLDGGGELAALLVARAEGQSASTPLLSRKTPIIDVSGTLTPLQF